MAGQDWEGDRGPSFWLSQDDYYPAQLLKGRMRADVAVVGGGFTGLWTAIALKQGNPRLDVCVLEQEVVGYGASGRNGGFCEPSLTHGYANGVRHFPDEIEELERLGRENFDELLDFVERHRIACELERPGVLELATTPWQVEELREELRERSPRRPELKLLEGDAARARLNSPRVLAALYDPVPALLNPARLARGLRRVAEELGVRVWERTPVLQLQPVAGGIEAMTPRGVAGVRRVVLATNAYSGRLLPRLRTRFVPVYDYVLVSEPLTRDQRERIGWEGREGASEHSNHFHYFRLTADDRLLWGGYDAVYHFGGGGRAAVRPPPQDLRPPSGAVSADVPRPGRPGLHPPLGRGHRLHHPLHLHLRVGAGRARGVRAGLHRSGGGGHAVRRQCAGGPPLGARLTPPAVAPGPPTTVPVPA